MAKKNYECTTPRDRITSYQKQTSAHNSLAKTARNLNGTVTGSAKPRKGTLLNRSSARKQAILGSTSENYKYTDVKLDDMLAVKNSIQLESPLPQLQCSKLEINTDMKNAYQD